MKGSISAPVSTPCAGPTRSWWWTVVADDDTVAICREYTDKVYIREDWSGFGPQKNRALSYATGEWVLSVDADERVSPALRKEIEHAIGLGALCRL